MCGIAGILTTHGWPASELSESVSRMSDAIRHRGPDDSGIWLDEAHGLALGFRRLSILDLSELGHQPMRSASGRYSIVFNGEVYNHAEVRAELEAHGHTFRGHSDTEVLLGAFEQWGVRAALGRFVGMFAIGLWDQQEASLHLIRDRLGIKPLFVYWRPGLLMFASELKAIVAAPQFDATLDLDGLASYFRRLYVPAPQTIYQNAMKLLPGHMLTVVDPRGSPPEPEAYWSLLEVATNGLASQFEGSDEDAIDICEQILRDAVVPRMQADVPLGAFLSGGIDSSLVVSLMQTAADRPVKTFSIGFEEEEFNEAEHASEVAGHLGTDHTELTITADDARAIVPRLADIFDEPFASSSAIPNFLVSELARRDVTVALSGTGGDEVFVGYNRYTYGEQFLKSAGRVPRSMRKLAAAGIQSVSSDAWDRMYGVARSLLPGHFQQAHAGGKIHKLGEMLDQDSPLSMYRSLVSSWRDPGSLVVGGREKPGRLEAVLSNGFSDAGWLERIMLADQLTYLADDQLAKIDRVSMAVSLEVRVPILDHRLVEFSWRLPRSLKRRDGTGKWLLRQILFRHVPRSLVERPKMGLSVPIDQWLRGPLRTWADELLAPERLEREGILRSAPIRAAWDDFQRGNPNALGIWTVIMFQAWKERWLG